MRDRAKVTVNYWPKSTTLDNLKRPYRTLLHKWCVFRSSSRRPTLYQQHKCSPGTRLSGNIRIMRTFVGVSWREGVKRPLGGEPAIFSNLGHHILGRLLLKPITVSAFQLS